MSQPARTHATGAERALDSGGHKTYSAREANTVRPGNLSSRDVALEQSESGGIVSEEIAKILSETDVYIKYNLHAKAIEHLQTCVRALSATTRLRARS